MGSLAPKNSMESVGPLKSFTRIDRSSLWAITAVRGGTEEHFSCMRMGEKIPSRISVVRSPAKSDENSTGYLWRLEALGIWRTLGLRWMWSGQNRFANQANSE